MLLAIIDNKKIVKKFKEFNVFSKQKILLQKVSNPLKIEEFWYQANDAIILNPKGS